MSLGCHGTAHGWHDTVHGCLSVDAFCGFLYNVYPFHGECMLHREDLLDYLSLPEAIPNKYVTGKLNYQVTEYTTKFHIQVSVFFITLSCNESTLIT